MNLTSKFNFVLPEPISFDKSLLTKTYGKFVIEPLDKTFGHTLGNSLRRTIMAGLGSIAVSWIKIEGVAHEFSTIEGVVEDVTDIVLNFKKVKIKGDMEDVPTTLLLSTKKKGEVFAKDIKMKGSLEVANPEQLICTLDKSVALFIEIGLIFGRGYTLAADNKPKEAPIGLIPIDTIFSPVERVSYAIEPTRVGRVTNYDKLILEVYTDGRISPKESIDSAIKILIEHYKLLVTDTNGEDNVSILLETPEDQTFLHRMMMRVESLGLSVRALNCLNSAEVHYVGELIQKVESEMLKYRNFGKKSLNEIKKKLSDNKLNLNMSIKEDILLAFKKSLSSLEIEGDKSEASN